MAIAAELNIWLWNTNYKLPSFLVLRLPLILPSTFRKVKLEFLIVDILWRVAQWVRYTDLNKEMLLETELVLPSLVPQPCLVLPCYVVGKGHPGSPIDTTQLSAPFAFWQKLVKLILPLWAPVTALCGQHTLKKVNPRPPIVEFCET